MIDRAYRLLLPKRRTSCAVFSSPHSGRRYPASFLARVRLDIAQLRSSEDAFVDELVGSAPKRGAPLLAATFSRSYIDLNRAAHELDPAVVHGAPKTGLNARLTAGLGVIPRVVAEGREIMDGKITLFEAESRIARGYRPYHNCLSRLLMDTRDRFGMAILFDCHSMPSVARKVALPCGGVMPDIVLGDRYGSSCANWLYDAVHAAFSEAGFVVARNAPFAGGHITQAYGQPAQNIHALQIEIDRGLYMDEAKLLPHAGFEVTRSRLAQVIVQLVALDGGTQTLAAE